MLEAVLFRMRNHEHELVCSVTRGVVQLHVDGQTLKPGVRLLPLTTLDEVMTDWPTWLARRGWHVVEEENV